MCIPCHRRKLKCDKGQPCSRCTQSGSADSCVYQPSVTSPKRKSHFKTPEPQSLAAAPSEKASDRLYQVQSYFRSSDGKAYATGTTHCCLYSSKKLFLFCLDVTLSGSPDTASYKALDIFSARRALRTSRSVQAWSLTHPKPP